MEWPWRMLTCLVAGMACVTFAAAASPARSSAAESDRGIVPIARVLDIGLEPVDEEASDRTTGDLSIRGIVTVVTEHGRWAVVADDSGAIWCRIESIRPSDRQPPRAPLEVGMEILAAGVVDRGAFAPRFLVEDVTILGTRTIPPPIPADLDRLFAGLDNAMRVTVEGVVQRDEEDSAMRHLTLGVRPRQLAVMVITGPNAEPRTDLLDARVRVTGIVSAIRNTRGEFLAPRIFVASPDDIDVISAPPLAAEAPQVPLNALAVYRREALPEHRIVTEGVVVMATATGTLFIEDAAVGVRVQTRPGTPPWSVGDRVRVTGFVEMSRKVVGIIAADVQRLGPGHAPTPRAITPDEIAAINQEASTRRVIAVPGDYDGCLVTFPARVVEVKPAGPDGGLLALSSGNTTLQALLNDPSIARLASIRPGSDVRVTGVIQLQLQGDEGLRSLATDPVVRQMSLLLRSADDVVVVRAPSWWTPARLAALLGALASVLAAALVWVALLRREVRSTTLRLADEMQSRRNAAIDFQATLRERNRLAANLHDTLLQTLRGIDFQLGACQAQGDKPAGNPWEYLDVARKMVNHAAEELRGSVWALRTTPVAGKSFDESLEAIARQTGHGHAEHIAVRTSGQAFEVPQFVAGNLLLVAQEAIHNALAHADAGQIDVDAAFDAAAGTVELTVVDDGRGFTQGTQSGPDQGHFGLTGMRERIERLGGTFAIDSRLGAGTTVRAKVRKLDYDSRIDVTAAEAAGLQPEPA